MINLNMNNVRLFIKCLYNKLNPGNISVDTRTMASLTESAELAHTSNNRESN